MKNFSELLRQGKVSLHCRMVVDDRTYAIVIVNSSGDFEYWLKDNVFGTLEFEKHKYTFVSNNQDHIQKVLKKI